MKLKGYRSKVSKRFFDYTVIDNGYVVLDGYYNIPNLFHLETEVDFSNFRDHTPDQIEEVLFELTELK